MNYKQKKRLASDAIVMVASVIVAVALIKTPALDFLLASTNGSFILQTFVAGLFFTSAFTTAPAIVILGKLGMVHSPYMVALIGGLGALIGDLIIFSFIKNHIAEDISALFSHVKSRRLRHVFTYRFMRWSLAFIGALVIASPLPDELGLTLMGFSKIKSRTFVVISLTFNIIGILAIAFIARSL